MAFTHHSRTRRVRRRWLLGLAALVVALAAAVPLAWASHQFTDVPDSNPFHTEISNLAGSGITSGKTCTPPGTPPTFCPNEPVVRQSMAAFMNRGLGRVAYATGAASAMPTNGSSVVLRSITLNVGGAPGGTQFVKVDAAVGTYILSAVGCPCSTIYWIQATTLGQQTFGHTHLNFQLDPAISRGELVGAHSAVFAVPTGTSQTFRVMAARLPAMSTGTVSAYAELTAITAPFGSTGGSTLGVETASLPLAPSGTPPPGP